MQGSDLADVAATADASTSAAAAAAYPTDESHWGHVGQSPAKTAWALPLLSSEPSTR